MLSFQSEISTSCGKFVLYFIFERLTNLDIPYFELLEEIFKENSSANEKIVEDFYNQTLKRKSENV